jgi:hypothetical protein
MECASCKHQMDRAACRKAAISIYVMGDEYIYSYWQCSGCAQWTIESFRDEFIGGNTITIMGPFPPPVGARCVALIEACPEPMSKLCECPSHKALYYGLPR